jgi:hypothetical protein
VGELVAARPETGAGVAGTNYNYDKKKNKNRERKTAHMPKQPPQSPHFLIRAAEQLLRLADRRLTQLAVNQP